MLVLHLEVRASVKRANLNARATLAPSLAASLRARSAESWGMTNVRLIKHDGAPKGECGSYEVRFPERAATERSGRNDAGAGCLVTRRDAAQANEW